MLIEELIEDNLNEFTYPLDFFFDTDIFSDQINEIIKNGMIILKAAAGKLTLMLSGFLKRYLKPDPADLLIPAIIHYNLVFVLSGIPELKHITNTFLEHSREVRKIYLLSRQHRGITADKNADHFCNCF